MFIFIKKKEEGGGYEENNEHTHKQQGNFIPGKSHSHGRNPLAQPPFRLIAQTHTQPDVLCVPLFLSASVLHPLGLVWMGGRRNGDVSTRP